MKESKMIQDIHEMDMRLFRQMLIEDIPYDKLIRVMEAALGEKEIEKAEDNSE